MKTRFDLKPVKRPDRMSSYWKKEWPVILVVAVSGIIFNGSMSLIPARQGKLLDAAVYSSGRGETARQAAIFAATVLVIQALRMVKRFYVRVFANRTGAEMRRIVYNDIMHRDLSELTKESAGDLINKAVNDVDLCVEGMRKVTTEVFDTGVLMIGYLVSLIIYDWKMTLLACVFIPPAMWLAERLKTVIAKYNREARASSSAVSQLTYSDIERVMLYRADSVMHLREKEYDAALAGLEEKSVRANVLENSMQPLYNAIAMLGMGAVLISGGRKVAGGVWTVGTFTAYISIFTAMAVKASKAAKLFNSFQKSAVSWRRLTPYFTGYKEEDETDSVPGDGSGLAVSGLTFRWPGAAADAVSGISISAVPGEIVGITGPVACGKTSLGAALTGALPYVGSIKLDGAELSGLTPFQRSRRISYQGHSPQLLSDTIYNNITLGDSGDITGVLADVCFSDDLASMPEGLDTVVGNGGVRLSGGQQSRIALARALWHASPLVILDDPFASVDMGTERMIRTTLRRHYSDRIIILISHRLARFPSLDRILFLDGGSAVSGTHDELMKKCAGYAELYALQAEEAAK